MFCHNRGHLRPPGVHRQRGGPDVRPAKREQLQEAAMHHAQRGKYGAVRRHPATVRLIVLFSPLAVLSPLAIAVAPRIVSHVKPAAAAPATCDSTPTVPSP